MSRTDIFPRRESEFITWVASYLAALTLIATRIEFPESELTRLNTLYADYQTKYNVAEAPQTRTRATVAEKNGAKKTLQAAIRQDTAEYITRNHRVTAADRDNLGLPPRSDGRTPAPIAPGPPWLMPNTRLLRHIIFDYGGTEMSKAKPAGQHGVELIWEIADERPPHVRNLTHSVFDTHTPLTIEFDEDQRGKTLWYTARWENTRGEKGPWGEIQSVVIP
ncbi:MAG: hypothetical protein LBF19_06355 [Prevotellaceae bacterium]|jgi:hypothetical protein|nr:hypothetical protein [Prevotellaceae bacterium]